MEGCPSGRRHLRTPAQHAQVLGATSLCRFVTDCFESLLVYRWCVSPHSDLVKLSPRRSPLDRAAQLAARSREATSERDDAIQAASRAGFTLREIGDATELAHTTVKRIIRPARGLFSGAMPVGRR